MLAEIISVGTELLLGHVVNTDASFLAEELAGLGVDLHIVTTVGDNPARLSEAMRAAMARSDIVLVTGGLGPTGDDLTKQTLAEVLGRPLALDPDSWARLLEYFGPRPMPGNQRVQAMLPEGSRAMPNPNGTAPGVVAEADDGTLFMLFPGPPRELVPMFRNEARPILAARTGASIVSYKIRTFGIGEGSMAAALGSLLDSENPTAATYLGDYGEVFARVTAKAATEEEARGLALPLVDEIASILGDVVYGVDAASLQETVVKALAARGETVATAESCTGGLLAKRITDVPGASEAFRTGVVTYSNEAKTRLLGVSPDMLARFGAVSPEVAKAMAEGVRERSGADYGIGVTGVAGPGGGTPEKPVGLVWVALSSRDGCVAAANRPQGRYLGRDVVRQRATGLALDMLRRKIEGKPVPAGA